METNLNKRFRTRKEQQLANKFRKYGAAKALSEAWNSLCEPCRGVAARKVEGGTGLHIDMFCADCKELYTQKLKIIVEKEFGGELYDGDKRIS